MFYLKTKIGEGIEITAEITDENVYSRCVDCGREVQTPLDEEIVDGSLDLFGTGVRCADCSYKYALRHRGEAWAEALIADYLAGSGQ